MIVVRVSEEDKWRVIDNAKRMCLGGFSNVRKGEDRERNLFKDQLVSQIAEYSASVYLTGNPVAYFMQRDIRNADPYNGDGGQDLYGIPRLDVKGRSVVNPNDARKKELLVRPKEMKPGWKYVHCIVPTIQPYRAIIAGWAMAEDFGEPYRGDIEWKHGIHVISVANLRDIRDLRSKIHTHDNSTKHH